MRRGQCCSLGLALLAACSSGSKQPPPPEDTAESAQPIVAAPAPAPGDTSCPATGRWARCSAIKAIYRAGLNTHADEAKDVTEAPLSITGFELPLSRGVVRFFVYADSNSRRRDQMKLDSSKFAIPPREPVFGRQRALVPSANLLVLMDVSNSKNRERIANALMAGPPQPPSNKP
jgi:hypothetical protein